MYFYISFEIKTIFQITNEVIESVEILGWICSQMLFAVVIDRSN